MKSIPKLAGYAGTLAVGLTIGFGVTSIQAEDPKPAYMVVSGTVVDAEGLGPYGEKAGPLARAAGLTVLARGNAKLYEGEWKHPPVLTVERFDSMQALDAFWNSEGYQEAIKLREGKFVVDFIVAVEGGS